MSTEKDKAKRKEKDTLHVQKEEDGDGREEIMNWRRREYAASRGEIARQCEEDGAKWREERRIGT